MFPSKQKPYVVRVQKVTVGGWDVSGATIKLDNLTKATYTSNVSSETNSNIAIPLAGAGDFDIGDDIQVTATYGGKSEASAVHTTVTGDHGVWNVGEIQIAAGFMPRVMFF